MNLLSSVNCVILFRKLYRMLPLLYCHYLLWLWFCGAVLVFSLFLLQSGVNQNFVLVSCGDSVIYVSFSLLGYLIPHTALCIRRKAFYCCLGCNSCELNQVSLNAGVECVNHLTSKVNVSLLNWVLVLLTALGRNAAL